MTEGNAQTYIVNIDFDGGSYGEYITADPALVADWLEAKLISPVDENGQRLVEPGSSHVGAGTNADPREVTPEDVAGAELPDTGATEA